MSGPVQSQNRRFGDGCMGREHLAVALQNSVKPGCGVRDIGFRVWAAAGQRGSVCYFFFSFFIFLVISSISFGFNSASTLSTILAMTADSDGPASDAVSAAG